MNSFNKNLDVGSFAIIVISKNLENLGKTVLIKDISNERNLIWPNGQGLSFNPTCAPAAFVEAENIFMKVKSLDEVFWENTRNDWIPLENLMPLNGNFEEEEEGEDVLLSLSHH